MADTIPLSCGRSDAHPFHVWGPACRYRCPGAQGIPEVEVTVHWRATERRVAKFRVPADAADGYIQTWAATLAADNEGKCQVRHIDGVQWETSDGRGAALTVNLQEAPSDGA